MRDQRTSLAYQDIKAISAFGLLLGVVLLLMTLTSMGGQPDALVDWYAPIVILIGSLIGLAFSYRRSR